MGFSESEINRNGGAAGRDEVPPHEKKDRLAARVKKNAIEPAVWGKKEKKERRLARSIAGRKGVGSGEHYIAVEDVLEKGPQQVLAPRRQDRPAWMAGREGKRGSQTAAPGKRGKWKERTVCDFM